MIPSTAAQLREGNLSRALRWLHLAEGESTRAGLARALAVTPATAGVLAGELVRMGLVVESAATPSGQRGRPTTRLVPAPGGPVMVAVELGIDSVRVAEVSLGGRVKQVAIAPLRRRDAGHVLALARTHLRDRLAALGQRCAGIGVAAYGLVERGSATVVLAPNLGWRDVDLRPLLDVPTGLPVHVDNVARLAARAEVQRGSAQGASTALYIHAAVGLGGALVLDGEPASGRGGLAGEYGHLPLGAQQRACHCGARGCWETEVDQLAFARAANRRAIPSTASREAQALFAAAAAGDRPARGAVDQVARALGRGLGALVNVHDPDLIVLAGHAAELQRVARASVEHAMRAAVMPAHRDRLPPVRSSSLSADAALLGAADVLFERAIHQPASLTAHTAPLTPQRDEPPGPTNTPLRPGCRR